MKIKKGQCAYGMYEVTVLRSLLFNGLPQKAPQYGFNQQERLFGREILFN